MIIYIAKMNVFTTTPVKVNIVSIRQNRILRTYVFIGTVPKAVEKELVKIQENPSAEWTAVKKFYGDAWKTKIGIEFASSKKGGDDEFSFDDIPSNSKNTVTEDDMNSLLGSFDTIDPIFSDSVAAPMDHTTTGKLHFIFDDVSVYPFDKVSEFKKKIYVVSGIPVYQQHVWVSAKTVTPLSYNISISGSFVPVNIQTVSAMYKDGRLMENAQQIENIPINTIMSNAGGHIRVESHDEFKILEEYHTKYGLTEFNVADIDEFIPVSNRLLADSILKNKQHTNLLYYGFVIMYWPMITSTVFREYLKGPVNLNSVYPDLCSDLKSLKSMFTLEKSIIDVSFDLYTHQKESALELVASKISNSITSAVMSVSYVSNSKENFIFVRNLFDKIELTDKLTACRCYTSHKDKSFVLDKVYKHAEAISDTLSSHSVAFRIIPPDGSLSPITVTFYRNGNYIIKSDWRDEANYDFDSIFKTVKLYVDPLIASINKMAPFVLYEGKRLSPISKHNTRFVEIGLNIYYRQTFTESQFAFIKFILEEFRHAGLIDGRNVEKNYAEYYFRKGMYQFDSRRIEKITSLANYYEHMSDGAVKQKWFTIFEKTRIVKIWHRFSDIKIEIYGIKEKEFNTFFDLIKTLFHLYETRKRETVEDYELKKIMKKKSRKSLVDLKEQDPVLYDFKKMYKSDKVYSRICQKSYQPLIINKTAYDTMPADQKSKVVKYWNFTTETDAYYHCPNPKYPYIKFITKNHPKDYCIPCCKKIDVSPSSTDPKKIIHEACLRDHEYNKERKTVTVGSKYIMAYGKDIEAGRLSKLPEDSMEGIFYETFSMEHGADQSYMTSDGFYLYGTNQHTPSVMDVGYVYSLAHSLEMTLDQLIDVVIDLVKKIPGAFSILLKGSITHYMADYKELIQYLLAFKCSDPEFISDTKIPWNKLFMDLAYNYLSINTVLFQHVNGIELRLPNGLEDATDYITQSKKNLIVLQKDEKYYPVYLINTDLFFKLGIIEKKLFMSRDGIIRIIENIVNSYIKTIQIKGKTHSKITLSILREFLAHEPLKSKYIIHKLFINHSNFCYGVQFHAKEKDLYVYVPIEQSHYSFGAAALEFDAYSRRNYPQTFETLMLFVNDFNRWVDVQMIRSQIKDVQDIYPVIRVDSWIVLQDSLDFQPTDKVIGFRSAALNYYFSDMSHSDATKVKKVRSTPVLYDPDIINATIHAKSEAKSDRRIQNMPKILYKYNAYQLFLLEFLKVFSVQKNTTVRTQLKKSLLGDFIKNMGEVNKKILSVVKDREDIIKVRLQLSDYVNNHHDRKQLFLDIDNSSYNFDKTMMLRLISMDINAVKKELKKISKGFVKIGEIPANMTFPNMFSACSESPMGACKGNSLILSQAKCDEFIDILAHDMRNPIKQKWLFSDIMVDRVVDFLRFISRPNETIYATIVSEV